jgi:hypothetical protein
MDNDSLDQNDFRVKLVSKTTILCKSLLSDVAQAFTYPPDLHTLVNAALLTGSFSDVTVAKHIQAVLNPLTVKDPEDFRARLCPAALIICRNYQKALRRFFMHKPDVHAVANALLVTGTFDSKAIVDNIFQTYASVDIDAIASQDPKNAQDNSSTSTSA